MYVSNLSNLEILQDRICCDLREAQISSCSLDTMEINGFNWIESTVNNSNLNEVKFRKCVFDKMMFFRSNMERAVLECCNVIKGTQFSGITLIKSKWLRTRMHDSIVENSTMMRAEIDGCFFENDNFVDYEAVYSTVRNTIFKNCNFRVTGDNGMNGFYQAKIDGCFFINCDFSGYPFREANVRNCVFIDNTGHITDSMESYASIGLGQFTQDDFQGERKLSDIGAAQELIRRCREA
ncbi:MAG TPA: hypothetical protein DCO86_05605 [Spirochaetaceae bacterium]|nr:hypothetical protein [Spirochaetaceae bacterium]